jgi:16S rRNA C967 or C1407 C5-methylase (RsmB/RsmF family)
MAMPVSKDVVVAAGTGDPMQGGAELEPTAPVRKPVKGTLERGWVSHRLIREIALGDKTGKELAEQYGVSSTSISNFKNRHALEIEEVRNNLADEYAGLWVAKKLGRITEYQKAAEKMIGNNSPRNAEVLVNILKAVAEELGQLPARTQVNITNEVTTYEIVGIDPEDI